MGVLSIWGKVWGYSGYNSLNFGCCVILCDVCLAGIVALEDGETKKTFALKMIALHDTDDANDAIGEAMRLSCIDHRNVVRVHEEFLDSSMSIRMLLSKGLGVTEMIQRLLSPYRICIALVSLCSHSKVASTATGYFAPAGLPNPLP